MKKDILILYPRVTSTDVYEMDYTLKFCKKYLFKALSQFSFKIIEYKGLNDLLDSFTEISAGYSTILFFNRSDILISYYTVKALMEQIRITNKPIVPTFNESNNETQLCEFNFIYHDIPTFWEFCAYVYDTKRFIVDEIERFDKDLIMCSPEDFKNIFNLEKAVVCKGAYAHKFEKFYDSPRDDLVNLLPEKVEKVLDIGCAKGGYGKRVKEIYPNVKVFGVEMSKPLAEQAKIHYDKVWIGKFEDIDISEIFDVINIGDVLEHTYDPWFFLKKVNSLLKPGGYLIGSIPNVSHWSIVKSLMEGRWEYVPVGLLCISHIRFFTEESLLEIMEESGFIPDIIEKITDNPTPEGRKFLSLIKTYMNVPMDNLKTVEIIFRFIKSNS